MPRHRSSALFALFSALSLGCNDDETRPSPAPVDLDLGGGFGATVLDGNRLVVRAEDGRVLLDGLSPGTVADEAPPLVGFAVRDVTTDYEMQFGAFKPTENANGPWRVAQRLSTSTDDAGAAIDLLDAAGAQLASIRVSAPEPGHVVFALAAGDGAERRFSWGFSCDEADHFAGFGAQTWDVDHRGQTVPTFVQEQGIGKDTTDDYGGAWFLVGRRHSSHLPIPQYLARRGYMLTAETNLSSTFALCSESEAAARVEVTLPATIHVFDGPSPSEAITRATATFGRPRNPPRVAFAPWLDAVYGSENVRRVAEKLRSEGVPSSVIWTEDWRGGDWKDENYSLKEEWEADTTLYPDFPELAGDLHDLGFDFHVYFNPFVYKESKAWAETAPQGFLVKRQDGSDYVFSGAKFTETGLIDLDNDGARAWAVSKMQAAIALGADGWMNDFAEWLPTDGMTAKGPSAERHNVYPVLWQEVAREAIDGVKDGHERLFFGRSGWFGTPALADVIWAGDQRTTMDADDGLPTVLPIGIGLGLVGVSTYGHDIAGYQSATNPGSTKEVFFRWTTLGAWSPVMRTHHGAQPNLDWSWEKDDATIAHFREAAKLHMALVPLFAGLAKEASETGLPIWRGLAIHFPEDASVWPITDEVMVGSGLLLAPVMTPGATSREVYLPEGRWYSWDGTDATGGPETVTAEAPVEAIPVFARAGAIVPLYPDGVMTLTRSSPAVPGPEAVGDDRIVRAFLGADGAFVEADGLSYAIESLGEAAAGVTLRFEGADLAACASPAVAPCADVTGSGAVVHVTGPGAVEVAANGQVVARVRAEGGDATRALTFLLRW